MMCFGHLGFGKMKKIEKNWGEIKRDKIFEGYEGGAQDCRFVS